MIYTRTTLLAKRQNTADRVTWQSPNVKISCLHPQLYSAIQIKPDTVYEIMVQERGERNFFIFYFLF